MLKETGYHRNDALLYAKKWALDRNPRYLDFENMGTALILHHNAFMREAE